MDESSERLFRPKVKGKKVKDNEELKPSSPVCYAHSSEVRKEFLDEEAGKDIEGENRVKRE